MNRVTRGGSLALCLFAIGLTLLAGCSNTTTPSSNPSSGSGMAGRNAPNTGSGGRGPSGGMMGGNNSGATNATSYSSDGQRIYLTGVGTNGQNIARTAPPVSQGSLMMGGGGCGSCHAANGRGGTIRMMAGTEIKAPDITYSALIKDGFTDATIQAAIRDGLDEAGKPLKDAMPRWQMNDTDLKATIEYLKVLASQ